MIKIPSQQAAFPFSDYRLCVVWHKKEKRSYACLTPPKSSPLKKTTVSYARYLMCVHLGRILEKHEQVDHIDNNKSNDVIENLQILTLQENVKKSSKGITMVDLVCPNCHITFTRRRGRTHLVKGGNPSCCSRKCGYEHRYKY